MGRHRCRHQGKNLQRCPRTATRTVNGKPYCDKHYLSHSLAEKTSSEPIEGWARTGDLIDVLILDQEHHPIRLTGKVVGVLEEEKEVRRVELLLCPDQHHGVRRVKA